MCAFFVVDIFHTCFLFSFFLDVFFFCGGGGEHFFPDGFGHSSIPKIESSDRSKFFILTWDAG